jgi:hypothetical protein
MSDTESYWEDPPEYPLHLTQPWRGRGARGRSAPTLTRPAPTANVWLEDGFEDFDTIDDLADNGWVGYETNYVGNTVEVSTSCFHAGAKAMECFAVPTDPGHPLGLVSKSYIYSENSPTNPYTFRAGAYVRVTMWARVAGNANADGLFLTDVESTTCWLEDEFGETPSPGIRLQLGGGNDYVTVERGKLGLPEIVSTARFPRDEFARLEWTIGLSDTPTGSVIVRLNDTDVLAETGIVTMPNAAIMGDFLGNPDFRLAADVYYDRVQVGITANVTDDDTTVCIDDVRMEQL